MDWLVVACRIRYYQTLRNDLIVKQIGVNRLATLCSTDGHVMIMPLQVADTKSCLATFAIRRRLRRELVVAV
jgi:hypothetical protein